MDYYSAECNLKSRSDTDFKKNPTREEMIQMFKEECVEKKGKTAVKPVKRNLSLPLETSSEEEDGKKYDEGKREQ